MFAGIMGFGIIVCSPLKVSESDAYIFKDKYCPQIVLINRMVSQNYKSETQGWDPKPWYEQSRYQNTGIKNPWSAYLKRTLPEMGYNAWYAESDWRYQCWDKLDDVVNAHRYADPKNRFINGLNNLYTLLGPERFYAGWMPSPIPDMGPRVYWLQELWTERSGFQGRLNNLQSVSPLD